MFVKIKNFKVEMLLKTSGIEFDIREREDSPHLGDMYVTKRGVIWCIGNTTRKKGRQIDWIDLIRLIEQ